jgi:hypothetical protein
MNNEIKDNIPARTSPWLPRSSFATTRNRVGNDNRQNQLTTGKLGKPQWPWLGTGISKEMVGWIRFYGAKPPASIMVKTVCDQVCQWLATGQWFFGVFFLTPVSSTNEADRQNKIEILLKDGLNMETVNKCFIIQKRIRGDAARHVWWKSW